MPWEGGNQGMELLHLSCFLALFLSLSVSCPSFPLA